MDRQNFIEKLGRQLSHNGLSDDETKRTLEWYNEVICDHIEEGDPEEQAVAAMGNPYDVADEIATNMPHFAGNKAKNRFQGERISENFEGVKEIRIEAGCLDVSALPSDDGKVTVEYYKYDRLVCSFSPVNGRLTAVRKSDKCLPPFVKSGITVLIPQDFCDKVDILSANGDIKIKNQSVKNGLSSMTASGDIEAREVTAGVKLELSSASGDINATQAAAGSNLTIKSASGDIDAQRLSAGEILGMAAASGDIEIKKAAGGRIVEVQTASGDIKAVDCSAGIKLAFSSASGDIDVKSAAAGEEICFKTASGDIGGTLTGSLSDYSVRTVTRSGDSNLPSHLDGGEKRLAVKTVSGDIKLRFSKHN